MVSFSNRFATSFYKMRKKWNKHSKVIFFVTSILNDIENKISKPLADAKVSHKEFKKLVLFST